MTLLLVDRLSEIVPWKSARSMKLVSAAEDFIQTGRSGQTMPRGLVLECAFQAAAWLIVISSSLTRRPAVLSVSGVRWFGEARAGDCLDTTVEILQHDDEMAVVRGEIRVGGTKILEIASGLCALLPTSDLDTPGSTAWMVQQITGQEPGRFSCAASS